MPLTANLDLLTPEFALAGLAFLVLAADLLLPEGRKRLLGWLSIAGLLAIIAVSVIMLWGVEETLYDGLLAVDDFSLWFKVLFMGIGVFIILSSMDFVSERLQHQGEFYGLVLFSVLGMNIMAQSRELLTAYIALELLSFSLYVLAAYAKDNAKSNEGGLKYIIVGAFSSAILLYGVSMVYGVLGVTKFEAIAAGLAAADSVSPSLWVGVALILVGLGFKVAAVPFHMWAPDVYEGAPYPITAYLSIGSKAAAFALVLRLAAEGFVPATDRWEQWQLILAVLAAVTMMVGNLVALAQRNLKRLMAYSSIGHSGFILAGVAALSPDSSLPSNGVMLYLVGYSVTNFVVFGGLISFFNMTGKEMMRDLAGLGGNAAVLGGINRHRDVFPRRAAHIRRVRHQVLPVHRHSRRGLSMAGRVGGIRQLSVAILLLAGNPANVHRTGGGRTGLRAWLRLRTRRRGTRFGTRRRRTRRGPRTAARPAPLRGSAVRGAPRLGPPPIADGYRSAGRRTAGSVLDRRLPIAVAGYHRSGQQGHLELVDRGRYDYRGHRKQPPPEPGTAGSGRGRRARTSAARGNGGLRRA